MSLSASTSLAACTTGVSGHIHRMRMNCMRAAGGLAVLVWVAGCAPLGPDHETPEMILPASFSHGGTNWKRQTTGSQPQPRPWWRIYNEPTLNGLVDRALAANQELESAAARIDEARGFSRAARSRYFPAVDIGGSTDRSKSRFRNSSDRSGGIENTFRVPLDLSYELDVWGKVRRQVEAARAREAAAAESYNALRLTIAAETASTYWALRAVDADRDLFSQTIELRENAIELLQRQEEAGSISRLDLARAETELATARAERIALDRQRVELVNALAVLTGSVATGSAIRENATLPEPPAVPTSTPGALLRQRPDIRAAEHRVAAANAEIGVAEAMYYPTFTIGGSSGLDSGSLSDLFNADSIVWSLGAGVTLPLTFQGLLRAQRDAVVAAHRAASADYRQNVLEAVRDVETALQASAILANAQDASETAAASALKTFDLSRQRYRAGLVSFLDVVDAERTRLEAERRLNAVRAERLAVSVALIKALGGHWR